MSTDIIANDLMKMTRSWTAEALVLIGIITVLLSIPAVQVAHFSILTVAVILFAYMLCAFFAIHAFQKINKWTSKMPSKKAKFFWGAAAICILEV
ncbi:MAG: hypothetical protein ACN6N0_13655, partial [Microvirgula sp.]